MGDGVPRLRRPAGRATLSEARSAQLCTVSQVEPFASLSEAVRGSVPRLLINRDLVGPLAGSPRSRDVVQLGDVVQGVGRLVELLGWTAELQDLVQRETGKVPWGGALRRAGGRWASVLLGRRAAGRQCGRGGRAAGLWARLEDGTCEGGLVGQHPQRAPQHCWPRGRGPARLPSVLGRPAADCKLVSGLPGRGVERRALSRPPLARTRSCLSRRSHGTAHLATWAARPSSLRGHLCRAVDSGSGGMEPCGPGAAGVVLWGLKPLPYVKRAARAVLGLGCGELVGVSPGRPSGEHLHGLSTGQTSSCSTDFCTQPGLESGG
ncbi:NAD-dependent protein deacetylase sirtuin-3, mitochondrial [Galemys pyrenaicus]|uniref:NAD-dependent protein deacetylase sirtuin-3, mitochondrial n=1 Tax=Galemys pyrenaicus TaxID=202257 RepID=A0A8J6DN81_GALPY|nr:NAD-dependent protein deacetylase sirtuin-3, mitochondrial [Galemys pyrenaicus]